MTTEIKPGRPYAAGVARLLHSLHSGPIAEDVKDEALDAGELRISPAEYPSARRAEARDIGNSIQELAGSNAQAWQPPAWLEALIQQFRHDWFSQNPILRTNYYVEITNRTLGTTFTEIDVFYKRYALPGVVFLTQANVVPFQSVSFDLGVCNEMESYVVGFFIGDELVAK